MGMVSAGVLKRFGEHARLGVEFYDAVAGRRGGFITLGMNGGFNYPISGPWLFDSTLFVGAGSGNGGYQLAGGGLMLRGSLGVRYDRSDRNSFGLGVSRVVFPEGGTIFSNQVYLNWERSFTVLFAEGSPGFDTVTLPLAELDGYSPTHHQVGPLFRYLDTAPGVTRLGGRPQANLQQVGFEWKSYLADGLFMRAETVGAMGGNSAGYMHLLAGLGMEFPLASNLYTEAALNIGGGGGGAVDTGGGLLYLADVGLRYAFADDWYLRGMIGWLRAPEGRFAGTGYTLSLGRDLNAGAAHASAASGSMSFVQHPFQIRLTRQSYAGSTPDWRSRPAVNVDNLGVQIDYDWTPHLYATGQAYAAYAGDAGAYMTGQIGMGYRLPMAGRIALEAEALTGAAGGGGINVGSGLVYQVNFGVGYRMSDALSLHAGLGEIRAANGPFRARVSSVSLSYHFNLLTQAK